MKLDLWTLALQTVNLLALLWLLQRFLYRPVQQTLVQRQQQSVQRQEELKRAQAQLKSEHEALDAERVQLAAAREHAIQEARDAAQAERDRQLAQWTLDAAEQARAQRATLAAERKEVEVALTEHASELGIAIARRLLEPLPRAATFDFFLDGACTELQRLQRGGLIEGADTIEVASVAPLDDTQQALCRDRIAAVLGDAPSLRFEVAPSLIAGIELRLPHAIVRNHWAQDLASVLEALKDEARQAGADAA